MRRYQALIPVAALAIIIPLLAHGCSCGHDFSFHLQSWLEAATQFRHGTLYPHWAFSAAFNAGEPRFVFYPPMSWMLGALLTLALPIKFVTIAYTFLALTAAGLTMYRLASYFSSTSAGLIATTLYIANPYMLFTAFERTAYAELLAAAWLPLLFLAALRRRPSVTGIALPVALLWLTNAPAAVMGCYALAVTIAIRLLGQLRTGTKVGAPSIPLHGMGGMARKPDSPLHIALTSITGTLLGLALSAFYLIPAAYERRFVQIAMAIIPNMRFEDNFLFGHTDDAPHNAVLHTASIVSLELLAATALALAVVLVFHKRLSSRPERDSLTVTQSGETRSTLRAAIPLAVLTLLIAFLLTPLSTPIWRHLPELAFLQFPWRLLSILAVCLALAIALLLTRHNQGCPIHDAASSRHGWVRTTFIASAILAILVPTSIKAFRQPCEDEDLPATHARLFAAHTGVLPTDEYTPTNADNDVLRADDPPYWFSTDPLAFAPGTTPNPASLPATNPGAPSSPTVSSSVRLGIGEADPSTGTRAPQVSAAHSFPWRDEEGEDPALNIAIHTPIPGYLIINLRDYPNWIVATGCPHCLFYNVLPHVPRDDGLIAVAVGPDDGNNDVSVTWRHSQDSTTGNALSTLALALFITLCIRARSRRIEVQAQ